jgi:subtilase family serine protease
MRQYRRAAALVGAAAVIAGSVAGASAAAAGTNGSAVGSTVNKVLSRTTEILQTCSVPSAHHAACLSQEHVRLNHFASGLVRPAAGTSTTSGYVPSDLHLAYALPALTATNGTGQTVGIVDAFNDPTAAADLATYRTAYGLPACTAASGCFRQVGESGTATLPSTDTGWAQEESLDLDMVSAICPNCKIILVEATSASDTDLATSVNTAVTLGATEVSNSYGGSETSNETSGLDKTAYSHPGVAITASAGDSGYGVEFPAASPTVTAVGGTSLTKTSSGRGWSETVWGSSGGGGLFGLGGTAEGTGSGCSAYVAKPSWQHDAQCTKRTVADVAAVADPNTGVAVYDSTSNSGQVGWQQFGGTSVASPIIASVYALAGGVASTVNGASIPYANTSHLNDVTSGSNGSCTGGFLGFGGTAAKAYLCTGEVGYDGPTGLGTPNGLGAF